MLRRFSETLIKGSAAFPRQAGLEDLALLRKELLRVRLEQAGTLARFKYRKDEGGRVEKAALAKLEEEGAVLAAQEQMLEKDISAQQEQAARIARDEADVNERLRSVQEEIAAEKQFHTELARRVRTSQVELNAGTRIRILQKAEAPQKGK